MQGLKIAYIVSFCPQKRENMITRRLENDIMARIGSGKAIIIMGARQVGKTTMLKNMYGEASGVLWLNGDEQDVRDLFANISASRLRAYIGSNKTVIIDEAQRIEDIGLRLKLITDQMPDVQLIATGSSSFDLANKINEPLTGRKWEYKMFPLSFAEMADEHGLLEEKRLVPHRMVFGYYPEIVTHAGDERDRLLLLADSYLYKDIFSMDRVKKAEKIVKLLQALAFQIGSEVSYNELAQLCGLDPKTVERYIILLEQAYIIFRFGSFSRNLRNELKNSRKVYFYDNGIRNAVIGNFTQIENRNDTGALFENFAIAERMKKISYEKRGAQSWFWRMTGGKEIDYLEEVDGRLHAYEMKWNDKRKAAIPSAFSTAYPDATFSKITMKNIEDFIL